MLIIDTDYVEIKNKYTFDILPANTYTLFNSTPVTVGK